MTREQLKEKYNTLYNEISRIGRGARYGLMAFIISFSSLRLLLSKKGMHFFFHSSNTQLLIAFTIIVIYVLIVVPAKSFDFVSYGIINTFKNNYKKDLFLIIKGELPEIVDHISYQKIHPMAFNKSRMFDEKYTDYLGDDWVQGYYNGVEFELCELHVYNSFKVVFSGIFVRCFFENSLDYERNSFDRYGAIFRELLFQFQYKHNAQVEFSNVEDQTFLAFKFQGKSFEFNHRKMITQIDNDLDLLNEIVQITKLAIDNRA